MRYEQPTSEERATDGRFPRQRTRRGGFTLIELLTVIGIILFMTACIIGVFLGISKTASVKGTRTLLERIGVGLARYEADLRCLPPDTGYGLPIDTQLKGSDEILYDPGSLWRYLAQEVVQRRSDTTPIRTLGPYIRFAAGELREYNDTKYGRSKYVVDTWGHPIGYVGNPRRVIHRRSEFDLFSGGPDGLTACDDTVDNDGNGKADEADVAYDGQDRDDASEMGEAAYNGCLTAAKRQKLPGEVLDDINNWDPQGQ